MRRLISGLPLGGFEAVVMDVVTSGMQHRIEKAIGEPMADHLSEKAARTASLRRRAIEAELRCTRLDRALDR